MSRVCALVTIGVIHVFNILTQPPRALYVLFSLWRTWRTVLAFFFCVRVVFSNQD